MAKGPTAPFFCTLSRRCPSPGSPRDSPKLTRPSTLATASTLRFYHGDCVEVLRAIEPGDVSAIVTSPPYNLGVSLPQLQRLAPRARATWSGATPGSRRRRARCPPHGSLVPQRRRQAHRPLDGDGGGPGGAQAPARSRTPSTGSSRSRSTRRPPAPPPALDRDLAVGHYKPINSDRFVNDCHEFVFQFTPRGPDAARPPRDRRAPIRTSRTSPAGEPAAATGAAAATRGSSPTRRSRTATRTARTRRPSRRASRRTACGSTASRACELVMDPFLGLGSAAVACAELGVRLRGDRARRALSGGGDRARAGAALRRTRHGESRVLNLPTFRRPLLSKRSARTESSPPAASASATAGRSA